MIKFPEGKTVNNFQEELRQMGEVAILMDCGFLLRTNIKATEVRDYIKERISPLSVYVTKVAHGAAWTNITVPNSVVKEWYALIDIV